jgi:hypothetical protein
MLASELGEPDDLALLEEDEEFFGFDEEDELWADYPAMDRQQLLAAETFHYSYANYDDHLGIGNVRFDKLMPDDVDTLEQAEQEGWDDARLARALEVAEDKVEFWRESYRRAKDVIDAPTPAESFRRGVRYSIMDALEEGLAPDVARGLADDMARGLADDMARGLADEGAVERLVTQICYRAADLAYLLDLEGEILSSYSQELRSESAADLEDLIDE